MRFLLAGLLFLASTLLTITNCVDTISLVKNESRININFNTETKLFDLKLFYRDSQVLKATLGHDMNLDENSISSCTGLENCYDFSSSTRMHVRSGLDNGFTIYWKTSIMSKQFMDCVDLDVNAGTHWYGGPERNYQHWPLEKLVLDGSDYSIKEANFSAISEPYWLNSKGAYLYVNEKVPLFVDQNTRYNGKACFIAKAENPYLNRQKITLNYTLVASENVREAHLHAVQHFLGKPTGHPNRKMISRPIWSTWARYKKLINDSVLIDFANEIVNNGFEDGQFEIDDYWETCYGSLQFGEKFPNINETVATIKEKNFRVTLWVHPFVNINCAGPAQSGIKNDFLTKAADGSMETVWWNSVNKTYDSYHLDFTNPETAEWFVDRLNLIKEKHGIDAFKFDAGEPTFTTDMAIYTGDPELFPNIFSASYVKTIAVFGDLIEIRTGFKTQYLPVFVRMIDKDSKWDSTNGLYTLITTLLTMNLNGYTMVLPDMIGGNGYDYAGGGPNVELFIRWLQANTFMPAIQFSFVPWDYDTAKDSTGTTYNVVDVSKKFVALHEKYSDYIIESMENSIKFGYPVNAPIWWVDPTDPESLSADTEYMLGEDLLVAPVVEEGSISRDIYLPKGQWIDGNNGSEYEGRQTLSNYYAPLDTLPYFTRKGSPITSSKDSSNESSAPFTHNSSNFSLYGIGFIITMLIYLLS